MGNGIVSVTVTVGACADIALVHEPVAVVVETIADLGRAGVDIRVRIVAIAAAMGNGVVTIVVTVVTLVTRRMILAIGVSAVDETVVIVVEAVGTVLATVIRTVAITVQAIAADVLGTRMDVRVLVVAVAAAVGHGIVAVAVAVGATARRITGAVLRVVTVDEVISVVVDAVIADLDAIGAITIALELNRVASRKDEKRHRSENRVHALHDLHSFPTQGGIVVISFQNKAIEIKNPSEFNCFLVLETMLL